MDELRQEVAALKDAMAKSEKTNGAPANGTKV